MDLLYPCIEFSNYGTTGNSTYLALLLLQNPHLHGGKKTHLSNYEMNGLLEASRIVPATVPPLAIPLMILSRSQGLSRIFDRFAARLRRVLDRP